MIKVYKTSLRYYQSTKIFRTTSLLMAFFPGYAYITCASFDWKVWISIYSPDFFMSLLSQYNLQYCKHYPGKNLHIVQRRSHLPWQTLPRWRCLSSPVDSKLRTILGIIRHIDIGNIPISSAKSRDFAPTHPIFKRFDIFLWFPLKGTLG